MNGIPLTRCQFLIPFAVIHNDIGAPTEALLAKFRLPTSLEEKADHYVPILPAIRFAEAVQRSQGITDIGFQASRLLQFCHLSEKLRIIIGHSPTLLAALQQVCKWAPLEDTNLTMWLERCDDTVRICSKLIGTTGLLHLEHSQWLQNVFPIHIVRQFTGPDWTPSTIAFEANYTPSQETQSFWPNTRFLSGQHASWIDVHVSQLSCPNLAIEPPPNPYEDEDQTSPTEIVRTLKLMLPSYLDEGAPTVTEIAEMAGISVRSFQRKLSSMGLSYSGLVDVVRFESAAKRLRDTDAKIIDVAFSCGYADPAHFTRAFRRISGTTPREFRDQWRPR
ncbi:AraC family transcriptional regulator [Pseudorhodoplanes sinuspersici]|uniref:AraC family transcriptional regulator n=1 Tax=Pseudorhodoplanes sinuspersici TaxID=1235591 RepID=A0A1W6ZMI8_9HYPH|nr:AraC family transcriptional regulator [Pseudorhodoplanes sinuspersici]ARP98532.1 AraC family transcriptional regulator [Pseudorhodoplanes sinuspersici]RKE69902.1 AraC family transcriptional regulator [Pseudorhodoplanes sinuspersici]